VAQKIFKKKGWKENEKSEKNQKDTATTRGLKEETAHAIVAIVLTVIAIFLAFAPTGKAGVVGKYSHSVLAYLFGTGYWLVPIIFLILAFSFFRSGRPKLVTVNIIGAVLFLVSGLSVMEILFTKPEQHVGGIIGFGVSATLIFLFEKTVSTIISIAILVISIFVIFDTKKPFWNIYERWKSWREARLMDDEEVKLEKNMEPEEAEAHEASAPIVAASESQEGGALEKILSFGKSESKKVAAFSVRRKPYTPPPLELLSRDVGKPSAGDIKANANIIKRTLQNFGIEVEMDEVSIGPSITRYALKPAEGVKLSRIVGLQKELSLALAAHPLRIEAPIPGKSLVGIEIPNNAKTIVTLGTLFNLPDFKESPKPLLATLGRGISGFAHFVDLAKMPHLLIAGTTGSGKSVVIHTLITSLLYRNSPENLRFIMIDPKRVELTLYNKIPHLLTPVLTNPKKAILSLRWAAKEMDRRYDILEAESVRDISSYHENVLGPALESFRKKTEKGVGEEDQGELEAKLPETMPYIVVVIDELADMMSTYPREMEVGIVRLAQMSRAVGIHLVLSTQRPSTEVITGLIKANVPARIALQVPSQIDSRTIIDIPGAEKLLGAGDMLYLSADSSKPQRFQSAYISEGEVKKVVKFLTDSYQDELPDEVTLTENEPGNGNLFSASFNDEDGGNDDELYEDARSTIIDLGKASTSLLQRKMRIGYARAARLLDMLEERGVVGPGEGNKPRDVYIKKGDSINTRNEINENSAP